MKQSWLFFYFIVCTFFVTPLSAQQTSVEVPSSAQIEQIQKSFEAERVPLSEEKKAAAPEKQAPEEDAAAVTFTLNGIIIEGSTLYTEKDFVHLYQDYLSQKVSLNDVNAIAEKLSKFYRDNGYILSRAIIPAQKITEGIIHIQIIEGFIDEVVIEGDVKGDIELLKAYGDKIKQSKPLHNLDLERYLLLAGDLPGVKAQGVLKPSPTTQGASQLIMVLEHTTYAATASIDNSGSRFVGREQFAGSFSFHSGLGLYENITFRYVTSLNHFSELHFGQIEYQQPLTDNGTTISLKSGISVSEPGFRLKNIDIDSHSNTHSITVSHPFIRSREENLSATIAVNAKNSRSTNAGDVISKDQIRSLTISTTYDWVDTWQGVNLIYAEFNQGLNAFGGKKSNDPSRAEGHYDFSTLVIDTSRLQRISSKWGLLLGVNGQIAPNPLPSGEEFGVGGNIYGRGYDPSEITGDMGIVTKLELQYSQVFDEGYLKGLQIFGFYDFGKVWNLDKQTRESEDPSLASVGLGTRMRFEDQLTSQLFIARQLTHKSSSPPTEARDTRIILNISKKF